MNIQEKIHSVVGTETFFHLMVEKNKFERAQDTSEAYSFIKREIRKVMPFCYVDESGNAYSEDEMMVEVMINPDLELEIKDTVEVFLNLNT
jgi:hypothetical protein